MTLVDDVCEKILRRIKDENLTAGDRLPTETELLESYRVSRSVLREAITQLETFGMVDVRRGLGMFVGTQDSLSNSVQNARSAMTITPQEFSEFGRFRAALECWVAKRAAERATPEQVLELEKLVDRMDDPRFGREKALRIDYDFHRKLFEIAGIALISNINVVLQEFVLEGMHRTTPEPRERDASQLLHRAILSAVRNADPQEAAKAMRRHMDVFINRLSSLASQDQQQPPSD